jgi:hypothetical protein
MTLLALIALATAAAVGIAAGIGRLVPALKGLDASARIGVPLTAIVAASSVAALVMAETLDRGADDCDRATGRDAAFGVAFFTLPSIVLAFVLDLVSRDTQRLRIPPAAVAFAAGVVDVVALFASFHLCFTF